MPQAQEQSGREAKGTRLPGWLVVVPTRHVTSLAELSASEAGELGPLLRDVTRALEQAVGCTKMYVALFAEAEGFGHVHFHVIPRMRDQEEALRGPGVFRLLGASEEERAGSRHGLAVRTADHDSEGQGRLGVMFEEAAYRLADLGGCVRFGAADGAKGDTS